MNYPTMEPAQPLVVQPAQAVQAPVMVVPQTEKKCHRGRGRGKCKKIDAPTVVTGTPAQVEAAKEEVNKYASRIHVTAIALILIGVISLMGSIWSGIHARKGAEKWLTKAMERAQSHEAKNATKPEPKPEGQEFVSMAEFALVDNLRMISFLFICISASIIKMGKTGLRASWKLNSHFTKKVYRKSFIRIAFIVVLSFIVRSYIKDSKAVVNKQVALHHPALNKTDTVHKKHHHSRKLAEYDDEDFEIEEDDEDFGGMEMDGEGKFRHYMDAMRNDHDQEEFYNQDVETAQSHMKKEVPAWMRNGGMFDQPQDSNNGVTFEADTPEEKKAAKKAARKAKRAAKRQGKKDKKHGKNGKKDNKKDHAKKDHSKKMHCCKFFPVCFLVLVVAHLYQLRNLKTSLIALEALGANMKGYNRGRKTVASPVAVDEESQPQNIEYSFDEHVDKQDYPVVSQPAPAINYSINEPSTQMA